MKWTIRKDTNSYITFPSVRRYFNSIRKETTYNTNHSSYNCVCCIDIPETYCKKGIAVSNGIPIKI
jgi:hypothetical protein